MMQVLLGNNNKNVRFISQNAAGKWKIKGLFF